MAAVIGKNIMLYKKESNGTFYMNGSIPVTTISGLSYKQFSSTNNLEAAFDFNKTADGIVCGFITDVATTTIPAGTWTFSAFASITGDLISAPRFYYHIYKYNGTTLTSIGTTGSIFFTQLGVKQYTQTFAFPATSLLSNERIVIQVVASEITSKTMTFYTQGTYIASVQTTIPLNIPFACSTNATFSVTVDQKEVTSQSSAWYREFKNDVATWNLTCDGLITLSGYGYNQMLQVQQTRERIGIDFIIDNGVNGLSVITGNVNLTSLQINAPYKDVGTYSVSLQGTGAYAISGTSAASGGVIIIGANLVLTKGYTASGGETSITFADTIGYNCLYVSRGGVDAQNILTSGVPTGDDVKFVSATGVLTFGRALAAGEYIRGLFQ
jgi:predicted secreted protein